jgi:hypothetical protein
MIYLVVKNTEVGRNEAVPECWTSNDGKCYWPPKDPQGKVHRGGLLKTALPQNSIQKISAHIVSLLSFTFHQFSYFC